MKRFLKKRFLGIPILVILLTVVIAGTVLAAPILTIQSHVKVIEPPPLQTYDILAFSDRDCTLLLTFIEWDEVMKGKSLDKTVYIENVGNSDALVSASLIGLESGSKITLSGGPVVVYRGQKWEFPLTLTVAADAIVGSIDFQTVFTSTLAP